MSQYLYSRAQINYLKRKHAADRELETGCDCPGCPTCKGHVRNCECDIRKTVIPPCSDTPSSDGSDFPF